MIDPAIRDELLISIRKYLKQHNDNNKNHKIELDSPASIAVFLKNFNRLNNINGKDEKIEKEQSIFENVKKIFTTVNPLKVNAINRQIEVYRFVLAFDNIYLDRETYFSRLKTLIKAITPGLLGVYGSNMLFEIMSTAVIEIEKQHANVEQKVGALKGSLLTLLLNKTDAKQIYDAAESFGQAMYQFERYINLVSDTLIKDISKITIPEIQEEYEKLFKDISKITIPEIEEEYGKLWFTKQISEDKKFGIDFSKTSEDIIKKLENEKAIYVKALEIFKSEYEKDKDKNLNPFEIEKIKDQALRLAGAPGNQLLLEEIERLNKQLDKKNSELEENLEKTEHLQNSNNNNGGFDKTIQELQAEIKTLNEKNASQAKAIAEFQKSVDASNNEKQALIKTNELQAEQISTLEQTINDINLQKNDQGIVVNQTTQELEKSKALILQLQAKIKELEEEKLQRQNSNSNDSSQEKDNLQDGGITQAKAENNKNGDDDKNSNIISAIFTQPNSVANNPNPKKAKNKKSTNNKGR